MHKPIVSARAVFSLALLTLCAAMPAAAGSGTSNKPHSGPGQGQGHGQETGGDDGAPRQFRVDRYVLNPSALPDPDEHAQYPYARSTVTVSTARTDVTLLTVSVVLVRENTGYFGTAGDSTVTLGPLTAGRRSAVAVTDTTFPEKNCFAGPHPRQIVMITYRDAQRQWAEVHLAPYVWADPHPGDARYCHPALSPPGAALGPGQGQGRRIFLHPRTVLWTGLQRRDWFGCADYRSVCDYAVVFIR